MAMYFRLMVLATTVPLCSSPEGGHPADHVVGEGGEHRPCGVGGEGPRRAVGHPRSVLQVPDGQLDHGVMAMVGIEEDGGPLPIGDEGVMSPRGEEFGLLADQPGAPDDQPVPVAIGALGDLGLAADRVVDVRPILLGDGLDGPDHGFVLVDGDRVADIVVPAGLSPRAWSGTPSRPAG